MLQLCLQFCFLGHPTLVNYRTVTGEASISDRALLYKPVRSSSILVTVTLNSERIALLGLMCVEVVLEGALFRGLWDFDRMSWEDELDDILLGLVDLEVDAIV